MKEIKSEKKYGSLKNNLIYSYLLLGIVPLVIVSWFSYQFAKSSLVESEINNLVQTSASSSQFIGNWFLYRIKDSHSLAESKNNIILLKTLISGFESSGLGLGEYVKSDVWMKLLDDNRNDLLSFSRRYGYVYDLYLIDVHGNVLYSVAKESDLGTNLINGPYSNTKFSDSVKNTLKDKRDNFSSFERYRASNNVLTGFITTPIVDDTGDMLGVFAVQVRTDVIYDYLTDISNYSAHSHVGGVHQYLTDEEGTLMSPIHDKNYNEILNYKIDLKRYGKTSKSSDELSADYHSYVNIRVNKKYLGLKKLMSINNINLYLISEIEAEKAFSSISDLGRIQIIFVSISALIIFAFAYYRSVKIVKPISELTKITMDISLGETDKLVDIDSRNEIGQLADNFNHMQQVRLKYEKSLIESREKTNQVLADLNQQKFALDQHSIVAITDVKGTITFVNDLFSQVSGYSKEELIGKNHRLLKSGAHDKDFFRDMFNQLVHGKTFNAEICNKAKDGHFYWVDTTIVPFMNDKGKPVSYIAIRTDITKQKQVEVELIKSRDEAEKAVIAKSDFLASMSHEIRTPMNGVLGMLGLLINTKLDEDQLHRVKVAQSSGKALLSLINDILDFSKIEADKLDLEIIDFNLRGMLGEFAEAMAYTAQAKGLELVLDVTKVETSMVKGDSSRLRQVLTNIVGNAIKFTSHGEVVVRAEVKEMDNDKLLIKFDVSDTGIGIPAENISRLFESFSQVDASTTRKFGGTGLGLAIAKKLCVLMGGDISVKSVNEKGSVFTFSAILEKSLLSKQVFPYVDIKKLNLLIVDDNVTNCEVLRGQLEHWGASVIEAHNAKQALKICDDKINNNDENFFDIAFLDMQMPEMDGEQLGRAIISDKRFSSMKLVMMTSMGFQDDVNKFAELGFSGYFPKPATTSDLFDALAVVAEGGEILENAAPLVTHEYLQTLTHENIHDNGNIQALPFSENTRVLLVEDNHVNQLVAEGILSNFGLRAEIANHGLEALYRLNLSHDEKPYDLILMDCQMPEMDGYDASRSIRAGKAGDQYINIPIIAMTANAMQGDREKCLAAGMSDYLTKPIDSNSLLNKLKQVLIPDFLNVDNELDVNKEINTELVVWDKAAVLERLLGKEDLLKTVIDIFIKEMPERVIELEHAINQKDSDLVARTAHSIKGVAANMSALELQKIAGSIEFCASNNEISKAVILFLDIKKSLNNVLILLGNYSSNNVMMTNLNQHDFIEILNKLNIKLLKSEFISAVELKPLQNARTGVDDLVLRLVECINNFDNDSALKIINKIENVKDFKLPGSSEEK